MFNFVIKDFMLLKRIRWYILVYPIAMAVIAFTTSFFPGVLYVFSDIILTYFCLLYVNGYDEKNKSEIVLNSLPVNRSNIVMGKYISFILFILIGGSIVIVLTNIIQLIGFNTTCRTANHWDIMIAFIFLGTIVSVYYPIQFKFGYDKVKYFNTILYLMLFILPTSMPKIIKSRLATFLIIKVRDSNLSYDYVILFSTIIILILFLLSMFISIEIYNRKEF